MTAPLSYLSQVFTEVALNLISAGHKPHPDHGLAVDPTETAALEETVQLYPFPVFSTNGCWCNRR